MSGSDHFVWRPELPAIESDRDDDALFVAGDTAPYLPTETVKAICRKIVTRNYKQFGPRLVFIFDVFEPIEFSGIKLEMFARLNRLWNGKPPGTSKIFKIACIAAGRRILKGEKVTKAMFLNKAFLCKLHKVGDGPAAFTVIETLLGRITG